jgi:diguanylate cyclase (GGDEF)-like protein
LNKFAGFVYDPTPKQLPTWAIYTFILAFSIILGISLLSSYLLKVNRRLANAKETLRKTNLILSKEIEERKAIESSLRNSEIRYYTLFENMLGGFAYCQLLYDNQQSNDFIFLEVNPGFDLVTSLKNVKGKKVSEVIPEVNVSNPELFVVLQRVVEGGSPEKCEIFLNSLELWFSLSIYSTGDHYFIVIFDDITERQQLQQKYEHMAHIDFLTGLANRRYFMELAEAAIGRINRYGGCLSLLMLDLDHFKNINDKYGHQMGDKVLQKMSEVCKATLRDVDVIGRLGGEEFAILLPETDGKEAYEVAERLRNLVSKAILSVDKNQKLSFTTSVGAVSLTENDIDLLTLLNRADQALYKAKAAGRNIVITYNDTLAEQLDTDSLDLNVGN